MVASWIKMRTDLATDPAVAIIAKATRMNPYAVVGRLHAIWAWADSHTEDGRIVGIDAAWVDKYVGKRGFADAMVAAGWLTIDADGIEFPEYTEHNGDTAKTRAKDQRRKRVSRAPKKQEAGSRVIPAAVKRAADERDGPWCRYCGHDTRMKPVGNAADRRKHYDHIIPVCQGGDNTAENVVVACAVCNMKKNGRTPQDAGMSLLCPDSVRKNADSSWTREEESRGEKIHPADVPPNPLSEPDDPGDPIEDEPATGPHFLTFWNAYPRRGRKRQDKARAAWVDATRGKGADPALIVQKAHAYASSDVGRGTYCLSAWRWLEDGCWNDDPAAWSDKRDDDTQPAKPKRDYEALAKGGAA